MSCRYSLWLQYDNNKFYLSPRSSIGVEEESDFESVNYGEGCCAEALDRDWHFKLKFSGGCTVSGAWTLFNQLQAFLDQACVAATDLILYRQVCNETPLQYRVSKPKAHMIETRTQWYGILSMDLLVTLAQWPPDGVGVVEVGS